MIKIAGLNPLAVPQSLFEIANPTSGIGLADHTQRPPTVTGPLYCPPMIRQADMRPTTMMVLGKRMPGSLIVSKDEGPPDSAAIMPHFGIARKQPKGMLYKADPSVNINGTIMKQPDSSYGFLKTKLKQP